MAAAGISFVTFDIQKCQCSHPVTPEAPTHAKLSHQARDGRRHLRSSLLVDCRGAQPPSAWPRALQERGARGASAPRSLARCPCARARAQRRVAARPPRLKRQKSRARMMHGALARGTGSRGVRASGKCSDAKYATAAWELMKIGAYHQREHSQASKSNNEAHNKSNKQSRSQTNPTKACLVLLLKSTPRSMAL